MINTIIGSLTNLGIVFDLLVIPVLVALFTTAAILRKKDKYDNVKG